MSLFATGPSTGKLLLVDELNIVFIGLNTFVGFTTSVFSATIAHEVETGRLTPRVLRFITRCSALLCTMNSLW